MLLFNREQQNQHKSHYIRRRDTTTITRTRLSRNSLIRLELSLSPNKLIQPEHLLNQQLAQETIRNMGPDLSLSQHQLIHLEDAQTESPINEYHKTKETMRDTKRENQFWSIVARPIKRCRWHNLVLHRLYRLRTFTGNHQEQQYTSTIAWARKRKPEANR